MNLTENFMLAEFSCKDGTPVPDEYFANVSLLAENLQVLRNHIGEPVHVNSGYRTKSYNKKVGGQPNSFHLKAMAGDLTTKNYTPEELCKIIEQLIKEKKMKQGGLGLYPGFVHYDVRGTRARW